MNPVLLKPTGEMGSQVVLNGTVFENSTASDYHKKKDLYFTEACQAYDRLKKRFDMIVLEGAGSCAEVNLMPSDIVNFRMADYAQADVILVADIHRGGVFGQIVGTLECIPKHYRDMIKGFIINRFRGDITLFRDGADWIQNKTGKPVFGVLPWYSHFRIDAEDSVEIEQCQSLSSLNDSEPAIAVIKLSHISNFTDFHALAGIKGVQVVFIDNPTDLSRFSAVILPGSKNTRNDLNWLENQGWSRKIKEYAAKGGHVLGICGGYQILGEYVDDPEGLEESPGKTPGLNLLPVRTVLKAPKTTTLSSFSWDNLRGEGYEIHMGHTQLVSGSPLLRVTSRNRKACNDVDGCISDDGKIAGTYIHGMFDTYPIAAKWLETIGIKKVPGMDSHQTSSREKDYSLLRNHFERHVNIEEIMKLTGL